MKSLVKQRFVRKVKATIAIWRATEIWKTIRIAPDNEARNIIDVALQKRLKVQTSEHALALKGMADEILSKLKQPQDESMKERVDRLLTGVTDQAFWYHGQLAGLTTTWEFRVRFLALKLGIKSNVPVDQKSKKSKANKSVQHRELSEVIKEINKKTGNRLALKLLELSDLRNAIVHCNRQAIKAYAKPLLGKDAFKKIRGNVVVMKLDGGEITNLSDVQGEDEIEDHDLFGFFLDTFNSEMPKRAFSLFEESIHRINLLVELAAICFDERAEVFELILLEGNWPDEEMKKKFTAYFSSPACPVRRDTEDFFKSLEACFGKRT